MIAARAVVQLLVACMIVTSAVNASLRTDLELTDNWKTAHHETDPRAFDGFEQAGFDDKAWAAVSVPHNWDDYPGYRQLRHGNRHGHAAYRTTFTVPKRRGGWRTFLYFEGAGAYATVYLNGKKVGSHAGALTTFTIDVTDDVVHDRSNVLAVRTDTPKSIRDLPWVCGGCSDEYGFSEGSQPLGINRPVHVVTTSDVRVEPFGVHVWNDANATADSAAIHVTTDVKNYSTADRTVVVSSQLVDAANNIVATFQTPPATIPAGKSATLRQDATVERPKLWSPGDPHLYTLRSAVVEADVYIDQASTPFGIRTISWPAPDGSDRRPLLVNGKPVFINGTCEYQHLLGGSHAFSARQVLSRVRQIEAAGFNAFRDAHHPHDLRYNALLDRDGLLWWTQFSAHVWFDTPAFRENFKTLLREWVRERRNSPSLVLWGLQNESRLPKAFAEECCAIIRELDPTTSRQRKITTCNGGTGTDWDVPQVWSGTYAGDPAKYADDLRKVVLNGEYGAWRSFTFHTPPAPFVQKSPLSETRFDTLMESKILLGEAARETSAGHFQWIFATHDNPGRISDFPGAKQLESTFPHLAIGPVNNKGLLTNWNQPTDGYFLYMANYLPPERDVGSTSADGPSILSNLASPLVYIPTPAAGATTLTVYSNCDEVELYNDVKHASLGTRKRGPRGTHFRWENVRLPYNLLYAEGRIAGRTVTTHAILLKDLPFPPHYNEVEPDAPALIRPEPDRRYLYRINCGGREYRDTHGNLWQADRPTDDPNADAAPSPWHSTSWTAPYPTLPWDLASRGELNSPIPKTPDDPLFQTYRFGRHQLGYTFAVPAGSYQLDLYFAEPWYLPGTSFDCPGWRLFDVAANGATLLKDFDLGQESGGFARPIRKSFPVTARDGRIEISFPRTTAAQAVISAIAISTRDATVPIPPVPPPPPATTTIATRPTVARPVLTLPAPSQALEDPRKNVSVDWTHAPGLAESRAYKIRYAATQPVNVRLSVTAPDGPILYSTDLALPATTGPSTVTAIPDVTVNAGTYQIRVTKQSEAPLKLESLQLD